MRRTLLISILAIPALAPAQSNQVDLFSFVMTDAQLIAGAHVDAAKSSAFGQFVLSQIPAGDKYLTGFMTETGIDPRADLTEVIASWNGAPKANGHWLIAARGSFGASIETIEVNALKHGGVISRLPGVDLIQAGQPGLNPEAANLCVGLFTDGSTDIIGDCTSVHTAIQFAASSGGAASPVALKAQQLRSQDDLWFASVVPVTQFANMFAAAHAKGAQTGAQAGSQNSGPVNLGGVLKSSLFQGIQEVSGGVKLAASAQGDGTQFSAEVLMDTPENATSLLNVVNFVISLLKMNTGVPASVGLASVLGNIEATVSGSTLNIGLTLPESTLEQLFQQVSSLGMQHASSGSQQ